MLIVVLMTLLVLLPQGAYATPTPVVADAPTSIPAESIYRPSYYTQLEELRVQLDEEEAAAATFQHTIARGETLTTIAKRYGTSVKLLMQTNNLQNPNFIYAGQVLTLVTDEKVAKSFVAPVVHSLQRGETIWELAKRYNAEVKEILAANDISDPKTLEPGQKLTIPGAIMPVVQTPTRVVASRTPTRVSNSSGIFVWPTKGYISSGYGPRWGKFHYGLDIAANTGTPIVAVASGTVTDAGWRQGYGYMVRIEHSSGWVSVYGHSSKLYVKAGQYVQGGQQIAAIGQTGNATGPHVHLELIKNGKHQNPLNHLPAR
ncbi:MAG: M23 family metallopeptidase [Firmicutes bacterium]|nr:M23 family metallopeptidase [Bacillota bacterium]